MEPPAENVEFLRRGLFCYLRVFGPSVRRGFASPAWGLSSLPPFGHGIPPSGGVWDACAARFRFPSLELKQLAALRARDSAVRRSWDACAARGKAGPVMGLRPLLGLPCIPPRSTPKRAFNFHSAARATRLCCGSFLLSLRSLRRSPSAPR